MLTILIIFNHVFEDGYLVPSSLLVSMLNLFSPEMNPPV